MLKIFALAINKLSKKKGYFQKYFCECGESYYICTPVNEWGTFLESCRNVAFVRVSESPIGSSPKVSTGKITFQTAAFALTSSFQRFIFKKIFRKVWRCQNELYFCSPFEAKARMEVL